MPKQPDKETYAGAGVDIDAAIRAKDLIKQHSRITRNSSVLSDIGFFNGLFELKGYREPVLVSSADGVGTKLKIAAALDKHDTIGIDLVNHCVNDILPSGADPLFFLDYIGAGKLVPEQISEVVKGLAQACKDVGCVLIGGETAEMPGTYALGDYDLVGFIVGAVEKGNLPNMKSTQQGDAIIGLPSSGLHTNGYSLARKVFAIGAGDESRSLLKTYHAELSGTLGEALLKPHRCYYHQLKPLLPKIKGLAHITGGGFWDNIPRSLPSGVSAHIRKGSWDILPIFELIRSQGHIDEHEMYHVFNMGIGMVIFCPPGEADGMLKALPEAKVIGEVVKGDGRVFID
ncbi:MAG: phosphoribosylformylglycinamidine cyclo-ligase [Dehalococcoidia bacterium]|nr:phosphoribosylformylglycinamidine cyclo-ligase [Dehalococcoidia bacterium]